MPNPSAQDLAVAQLLSVLSGATTKVHVAGVERHGEKIILPQGMKTADAIESLKRQLRYDEEKVKMSFDFNYFVWDGAYALAKVMQDRYGFVFGEKSGFFSEPPTLIGIEIELGKTVQVPWGTFSVPSVEAMFECGYVEKEGKLLFKLNIVTKHMYEEEIKSLHASVVSYLEKNSIYKGKAFGIRFTDDRGKSLLANGEIPTPKFLDVTKDRSKELVFPKHVAEQIETNLFTVLERLDQVRESGIPVKRGILLAGPYGVGKTLTAYVAARKAVTNGITYIYCQKPEEFANVMRMAAQYAPCLVFCEDVDRIVPSERDKAVDELINIIDGVETKNAEIVTVFTTNDVDSVNQSLLRPGRMDAVIVVERADAQAVQQLIRNYAGKYIQPGTDLTEIGEVLKGNIPAVIREVCERSKLAALRRMPISAKLEFIPLDALKEAALTMKTQLDLLNREPDEPKDPEEQIADGLKAIAASITNPVITTPLTSRTMRVPTNAENGGMSVEIATRD